MDYDNLDKNLENDFGIKDMGYFPDSTIDLTGSSRDDNDYIRKNYIKKRYKKIGKYYDTKLTLLIATDNTSMEIQSMPFASLNEYYTTRPILHDQVKSVLQEYEDSIKAGNKYTGSEP